MTPPPTSSGDSASEDAFGPHEAVGGWVRDIAPYGVFTTDASLNIRSWNQWLTARSGLPAQDMIGRSLVERFPDLVTRGIHRRYHNALKGEISVLSAALHKYLLPFPAGAPHPAETRMLQTVRIAPLVADGAIVGTITIIEDVTERELQAAVLQRRQQHDHMLSRALSVLLRTSDPMQDIEDLFPSFTPALGIDAFFTHVSDPADQTLRLSASAGILTRLKDELATFPKGEGPLAACCATRTPLIVSHLQSTTDAKYQELRAAGIRLFAAFPVCIGEQVNGTLSVASYHNETLPDDETKFLATLAQYLAIAMERVLRESQLVAARKTLQEHAEGLEVKVRERTARLHDTIAQLESFSYTVAHDLRAPIRALQGYTEMLDEDFGHLLSEDGKLCISRLMRASKRLDALTRDLLRFSKLARSDVELGSVGVMEIIDEIKAYTPELHKALSVTPPLGTVRAQRTLLQQCLANLIENAVKFRDPRRTLRIHVRSESIKTPMSGSDPSHAFHPATFGPAALATDVPERHPWIRIWVEDNGIGVAERAQAKIFGIFERSTGSENIEGTGIGLAIVARAMQQMGGYCGVESEVGQGSRFWLELPAAV